MEGTSTVITALSTAFQTIADNMIEGIGTIAPIALGVTGVVLLWRFGAKFFKSIAK